MPSDKELLALAEKHGALNAGDWRGLILWQHGQGDGLLGFARELLATGTKASAPAALPPALSPKMQTALFHGLGISGTECVQRYRAMLDAAGVAAGIASASGSAPGVPVVLRNHHPNCAYATLPDQPTNCSCPPIDGVEGAPAPDHDKELHDALVEHYRESDGITVGLPSELVNALVARLAPGVAIPLNDQQEKRDV